jgi:hypothetical protein
MPIILVAPNLAVPEIQGVEAPFGFENLEPTK